MAIIHDATFWVAVSLILFIALLVWKKVPQLIAGALDKKIDSVRAEIDEARALKEEAQSLLAQWQRDQREAAKTAQDLIAGAEREAKLLNAEAERSLDELITRRTALAQQKIAQAEADAVKEVKQVAVAAATAAAAEIIAQHLSDKDRAALVNDAIQGLDKRVH